MWKLTAFLSLLWTVTLLYGEMFAFWVPLWTCSWPHLHHPTPKIDEVDHQGDYVKVAVLTDPQLMDRTSLSLAPKSLALETAQFYTDLFMRRAFLSSILPFQPDVILFLGDYFDGGPVLSDDEWQESWNRFRHIYNLNVLQETTNIKFYYLAGNHDIGYAAFHSQMPEVVRRYEKEFGARNFRFTLGKVDFIAIDAQTVDGNPKENLTSSTWDFVKNVSKDDNKISRVLLTHIPLYRADGTQCGPYRSSPIINQRISRDAQDQEILYQNYITERAANELLDLIKPDLILSGHDHDQCSVVHEFTFGRVKEHTLGTISWQQGNLYPSFMLLSAANFTFPNASRPEDAISTHLCFLPVQTYIYIWYLALFIMTLLAVFLWPTYEAFFLQQINHLLGHIRGLLSFSIFGGPTKEKTDDENCEYEMIWDAEGSMHLIRKTSKAPASSSTERAPIERGSAVMRSTARKQMPDVAIPIDASDHIGLEPTVRMPTRTNRSKVKLVIRRLVRTCRALIVIASFNVPIYMMLLFKDWIDK